MDQVAIGTFLKELRKEKDLTQEALADKFCVTRRSVSRWETGSNLPDIDILIELSDFYGVELREILDGKRRNQMNEEIKDTAIKVAEYDTDKHAKKMRNMSFVFMFSAVAIIAGIFLDDLGIQSEFLLSFLKGMVAGIGLGTCILGIMICLVGVKKIRDFKMRLLKKV